MSLDDPKWMDRLVQRFLNSVGAAGAEAMRGFLTPGEGMDTERLLGGISYASATAIDRSKVTSNVKEEDLPDRPDDDTAVRKSVNIGTNNLYSRYVNYGSLPIGQGNGSAEPGEGTFREKILEWAIRKWGDSPETRDRAMAIAKSIAEKGTDAIPFFEPAFPVIRTAMRKGIQEFSAGLGQEISIETCIVEPDGTTKWTKAHAGRRAELLESITSGLEHLIR
jgi:hypothetical protein